MLNGVLGAELPGISMKEPTWAGAREVRLVIPQESSSANEEEPTRLWSLVSMGSKPKLGSGLALL
jgi:hypothetical protein